jgi:hypothetical protein
MTEYTITVEGYESGLTASAIEEMMRGTFGSLEGVDDISVTVEESD